MNCYNPKNTMEKAASRARGDRLNGLYDICESQKTISTLRLISYLNAMHESDKLDAIHFRDLALKLTALESEVMQLRQAAKGE